jgi:hypothetical protein
MAVVAVPPAPSNVVSTRRTSVIVVRSMDAGILNRKPVQAPVLELVDVPVHCHVCVDVNAAEL